MRVFQPYSGFDFQVISAGGPNCGFIAQSLLSTAAPLPAAVLSDSPGDNMSSFPFLISWMSFRKLGQGELSPQTPAFLGSRQTSSLIILLVHSTYIALHPQSAVLALSNYLSP